MASKPGARKGQGFVPLLALALLFCFSPASIEAASPAGLKDPFSFEAASYLIKVGDEVVWGREPGKRLPPASLTKIMTAHLALKRSRFEDIAVVSLSASRATGSRLGLKAGERMRVGFLIAATLLSSANDACRALAEHISGTEARFVELMNAEAAAMGLRQTRFANACGHDAPGHYSTAGDLMAMAEQALKDRAFSDIVATVALDASTVGGARAFRIENKNELMGRYAGAAGVKSGYTSRAGKCVIALADRGGARALLVLLNAPNRWWDAQMLLDAAFAGAGSRPGAGR